MTEATGTRIAPYGAIALAGSAGREDEAAALIERDDPEATAGGQGTAVQYATWATRVLCNGLGRYEEALARRAEASDDTPELFVAAWAAERADRGRHAGRGNTELARDALERLARATAVARHRLGARDRGPVPGAAERG